MQIGSLKCIACGLLLPPLLAITAHAQVASTPARIEPGLEAAVGWTWWVAASDEKDWGIVSPEREKSDPTVASENASAIIDRPESYEVMRGDALSIIARKYGMTVAQLKTANGLTKDLIKIGQTLKIPTVDELKAMAPPPPPPEPEPTTPADGAESTEEPAEKRSVYVRFSHQTRTVLLQSFLDRENFPSGPIDGYPGAILEKAQELYRSAHGDVQSSESLLEKAIDAIGEPYIRYTLKPEDFRFIVPPKASIETDSKETAPTPISFDALTAQTYLAYRTPWEFVAERFHCSERFLRKENSKLKGIPKAGTEFSVPNVIPFEIEKAFEEPLQPAADPAITITAAIVDQKRLEIFREGQLVAAFPCR
jgi:LysM repeat protein